MSLYVSSGKTAQSANKIIQDAIAMEQAGASMILLEAVPEEVSQAVIKKTKIPVIGCGAGKGCHGQVVVTQDLAGMTDWQPSFAKPIDSIGKSIVELTKSWMDSVARNELGEHPYKMTDEELKKINP